MSAFGDALGNFGTIIGGYQTNKPNDDDPMSKLKALQEQLAQAQAGQSPGQAAGRSLAAPQQFQPNMMAGQASGQAAGNAAAMASPMSIAPQMANADVGMPANPDSYAELLKMRGGFSL